jgi:hypothetical protein
LDEARASDDWRGAVFSIPIVRQAIARGQIDPFPGTLDGELMGEPILRVKPGRRGDPGVAALLDPLGFRPSGRRVAIAGAKIRASPAPRAGSASVRGVAYSVYNAAQTQEARRWAIGIQNFI